MKEVELRRRLTVLKAEQGVGKTEQGLKSLRTHQPVLLLTHRKTLATDLQARFNKLNPSSRAAHYKDRGRRLGGNLAVVVNSLPSVEPAMYVGGSLYIDEVGQLLDSIAGATFDSTRMAVLSRLSEFLRTVRFVVVADRDVQERHVDFLLAMMGGSHSDVDIVENNYVPERRSVTWHGTQASIEMAVAQAVLGQARHIYVASDDPGMLRRLAGPLETLEGITDENGDVEPTVKVIEGDTDDEVKTRFLKNINESVQRYRSLLVSPALFTGVDINVEHFDDVFLLATNLTCSIASWDFIQALHRVRRPRGTIHVWVKQRGCSGPITDGDVVASPSTPVFQVSVRELTSGAIDNILTPYGRYYGASTAARNRDVMALPANVRGALEHAGYEVVDAPDGSQGGEGFRATLPERVLQRARDYELQRFLVRLDRAPEVEELVQLARWFRLNGGSWADAAVFEGTPHEFEAKLFRFELMTARSDEVPHLSPLLGDVTIPGLPTNYERAAKLLSAVWHVVSGKAKVGAPLSEDELQALVQVFSVHRTSLKGDFNQRAPTRGKVVRTLRALLKKVAVEFLQSSGDPKRSGAGPRGYEHAIDAKRLAVIERIVSRRRALRANEAEGA